MGPSLVSKTTLLSVADTHEEQSASKTRIADAHLAILAALVPGNVETNNINIFSYLLYKDIIKNTNNI